jgi:site-specific recombinase
LVSLIGNLVVVIPICFLTSYLILEIWDSNVFSDKEAKSALFSNHLFYSLSLFYALITGILLSLSGIVTGYIDNKVIYSHIALRIENHPKIIKKYALEKRKKIATFFEKNLGAIIGNLFLGFSLGMAGNFGEFIGIPYDIRHITISAGNFSIALVNMHWQDLAFVLTVFTTVILIGFINIIVSFLISFILACSSRGLSWKQSIKLIFNRS